MPCRNFLNMLITVVSMVVVFLCLCAYAYHCLHAVFVILSNLSIYIISRISQCDTGIAEVFQVLGPLHSLVLISIILLVSTGIAAVRQHQTNQLSTIERLRYQTQAKSRTITRQSRALIDCQRKSRQRDTEEHFKAEQLKELEASRITIAQFRTKADTDAKLLRNHLADAHSASSRIRKNERRAYNALKMEEQAALSKVKQLEDEIKAIPRWSDDNLILFADLRTSKTTLQQQVQELARDKEDLSSRLNDSRAARHDLQLWLDAERRTKAWNEFALGRNDEEMRALKREKEATKAELTSTQVALKFANDQRVLSGEAVAQLQGRVDILEQDKITSARNETRLRLASAVLKARISKLEIEGADSTPPVDVTGASEILTAGLEEQRCQNASLQQLLCEKDKSLETVCEENVKVRVDGEKSRLALEEMNEQLLQAAAKLATAEQRADALQDGQIELLEGKAEAEERRDEVLEENKRLANDLVVKARQTDEMRTEYEQRIGALMSQGEDWAQDLARRANLAVQEREQKIASLESELALTRVTLENLRSLAIEFERQTLVSQALTAPSSISVPHPAPPNPEPHPVQSRAMPVGGPKVNTNTSVASSDMTNVAPAPFVSTATLGHALSTGQPNNRVQTTGVQAIPHSSRASQGAPSGAAAQSNDPTTQQYGTPANVPLVQPQVGRRVVRPLPQKVNREAAQSQRNTQPPARPTESQNTVCPLQVASTSTAHMRTSGPPPRPNSINNASATNLALSSQPSTSTSAPQGPPKGREALIAYWEHRAATDE